MWINGAFGAGKTSVARRLARVLPARLYDPELVGIALHRITPSRRRAADFQDFRLWRAVTVRAVDIASRHGAVVVPMTVVDADIRAEVFGGLAGRGVDVVEFWLSASEATLAQRLTARGDAHGSWAHAQIERCLRFEASRPDLRVMDAEQCVEDICGHVVDTLASMGCGSFDP